MSFTKKFGENPRTYYGFPNKKKVIKHIRLETPSFMEYNIKVKKTKKHKAISKTGNDYLVYFSGKK